MTLEQDLVSGTANVPPTGSGVPGTVANTLSGTFLGTPAYMAPERVFDLPYDGRADVYAVGVMIYEMVSGRLPFQTTGGGHMALMRMHAIEEPPQLSAVAADAHPALDLAVKRAMAKEPEHRPTAAELDGMLKSLVRDIRGNTRTRRASDSSFT